MAHPIYTNEEIGRRGHEIYEQHLKESVEVGNQGKFLVLDIETHDYLIGDDYMQLSRTLQARRANAPLYVIRVGFPAVGRIGGHLKSVQP